MIRGCVEFVNILIILKIFKVVLSFFYDKSFKVFVFI